MAHAISYVGVSILGAGIYLATRLYRLRCSSPLPPGPSGWPVIGNLFQISSEKNWEDFAALGRKYGMYFPWFHRLFLQTPLSHYRRHFIHKYAGNALCRSQLVQGDLGGSRETEHKMFE